MVPGASALKSKCLKCAKSWPQPFGFLGQRVPSGEQFVAGPALMLYPLFLSQPLKLGLGPMWCALSGQSPLQLPICSSFGP